jgi:hypothetical protein
MKPLYFSLLAFASAYDDMDCSHGSQLVYDWTYTTDILESSIGL